MQTVWVFKYHDYSDMENSWQKILATQEVAQRFVDEIDKSVMEEEKITNRKPWGHDLIFGISYETSEKMLSIEVTEEFVYVTP